MFFTSLLIVCSLLQVNNEVPLPGQRERQPTKQQPLTTPSTTVPTQLSAPSQPVVPGQLYFQSTLLKLPDYSQIVVPAPERAVLMSLKTEQRDADGNIIRDSEGNPVIVPVRRGMKVFAGQELGNFDDRELYTVRNMNQAQLEVARAEEKKQIEAEYAAQGVQVAMIELKAMVEGNKRVAGTFPEIEVRKAGLALAQAEANLELQKYNLEEVKTRETAVRESELARTEVLIDLRKIVAPIDGIIVDIKTAEGKWLREGDTVLEIVNLETLWVQVFVDARRYADYDVDGKPATIRATLANGKVETFQGKVIVCDPTTDSGYTFMTFIEIQNRRVGNYWLLHPGYCNVDIMIPL